MLKKRDAEGMPLVVVVFIVLGLIVLLSLMIFFGSKSKDTVSIVESCSSKGGKCIAYDNCKDGPVLDYIECGDNPISGEPQVCCATLD